MYVIYGLGMQGEAILHYLIEATNEKIVGVDIDNCRLAELRPYLLEHSDRVTLQFAHELDPGSVVISCLPPDKNEQLTIRCIVNHCHMIDLGGSTAAVRRQLEQDQQARAAGSIIVPDCGLAPGIVSSLAAHYKDEGWTSVEAFCGGIPKFPVPPLSYAKVFSADGVIREYIGIAQEIREWKTVNVPALSGRELLFVPALGVLEAAVTTGGVSFSPDHLNLRRFSYKTLRYPGHWDFVEKHILNQPEPARVLEALIGNAGPDNPDIVVLAFRLTNDVGNCAMPSYFWEYEPDLGLHGLSAMAQSTGFIVGSVARMLHEGTAPRWGVLGMHEIDPVDIIANITEVFPDQFCELPLDFSEDDDG